MRIGIDARILTPNAAHTGIGTYATEMALALDQLQTPHRFFLMTDRPLDTRFLQGGLQELTVRWPLPAWQQVALPGALVRHGITLFHSPTFTVPLLSPRPTVVTVHDINYLVNPEWGDAPVVRRLKRMVPLVVRRATGIIAISEFTKRELVRVLGTDPGKITVTPLAAPSGLRPAPAEDVLALKQRYGLDKPYLLIIGTVEPRKNLIRQIQAFLSVRRQLGLDHVLVLAGADGWRFTGVHALVERESPPGTVRFLGRVPESALPALYSGADLVSFCSLYEGFGLPLLEAMACGVPVVTSNRSSLPEVAGDAALLADPESVDSIATEMAAVLRNADLRERLRQSGFRRCSLFTWDRCARLTLEAYESAYGKREGSLP